MKSFRSQNYYEILGVAPTASAEEIRRAFELSRHTFQENSLATYSLFTDEENQEILTLISRAYETLFHPELRREYDAFLAKDNGRGSRERTTLGQPPRRSPPPRVSLGGGGRQQPQQRTLPLRDLAPARDMPPSRAPAEPPPAPPPERPRNPKRNDEAANKFLESLGEYNGAALRKIRQLRGLSIEEVAERTKIRRTYIEYIEEEQFTFLPAPVYVKGFVSMIAGILEIPPQDAAKDYMLVYTRGHTEPTADRA